MAHYEKRTRAGPERLAGLVGAVILAGCGSSALDLHSVRWKDATVPGAICGAVDPTGATPSSSVQLHNGFAYAKSHRWADYSIIEINGAWDPVVYGDIDGDGRDEAAVGVDCSNGGGTAGGILAYARVIYTAAGKRSRVVGVIRPRARQAPGTLPPLLQVTRMGPAKIKVSEVFYGRDDGTCCPSGRAITTWALVTGKLVPRMTQITRSPR